VQGIQRIEKIRADPLRPNSGSEARSFLYYWTAVGQLNFQIITLNPRGITSDSSFEVGDLVDQRRGVSHLRYNYERSTRQRFNPYIHASEPERFQRVRDRRY
jgi:hypothetical protein